MPGRFTELPLKMWVKTGLEPWGVVTPTAYSERDPVKEEMEPATSPLLVCGER